MFKFGVGDKVRVNRDVNMPNYLGDGLGVIKMLPKKNTLSYSVTLLDDATHRSISVYEDDLEKVK